MSLSRFSGIRIISAALAAVFFFTQGGFAEIALLPQAAAVKTHIDILQDVHCNSQTQESIYKYLGNLHAQNKLSGILQEGASGNIDRSVWNKLNSSKRSKVMQGLYRDGWMGGAEKFAVEHPEVSYSGVELKALYDIHRDVYRDVISKQEDARESLRELNAILSELKSKFYSAKLIRLEQEWQTARRDGNSLYLFIKKHLKNIPENKLSLFSSDFRSLIEAIKNEKKPSDLTVEDFGSGMEKFHGLLREPLIQSDEIARLLKLMDYYDLLKELWNLELTPQSYEKFLLLEKSISLKAELAYLTALINKQSAAAIFAQYNRNSAKAYYEVAKRRDAAIYKNVIRTLKNKSGHFVLVAGGFHGQDLANRFKHSRISFSLIKPNFSEVDSNLQDKYARAMGISPSKGDLKVYVQNLMALIPEPVTVRPEFVQVLELSLGSSLGKWEGQLLSSDESIRFTTWKDLRIKTDRDKIITISQEEALFGEGKNTVLSDGINYFHQSSEPQKFTVENFSIPSIKIGKDSSGALKIGKFLPYGVDQSLSVRFHVGSGKSEDSDDDKISLDLDDVAYLTHKEVFSQEKSFGRWNEDRVSTAYIELGNKLVLVVEKSGKIALSRINKEYFDSVDDLEEVKELTDSFAGEPAVIASENIHFHKLPREFTDYENPFIITRQGEALSLRLIEPVENWKAELLQVNPPTASKFLPQLVVFFSGIFLASVILLSAFSRGEQIPVPPVTTNPPAAPPAPPAPNPAPNPAPPAPAPDPVPPAPEPVPPAPELVPPAPEPAPTRPAVPSAEERVGLPFEFSTTIAEAKHYIASPVEGIATVSSDGSRVVVASAGLESRRAEMQSRFDWLVTNIPIIDRRYDAELSTSRRVTPDVEIPLQASGQDRDGRVRDVQALKEELNTLLGDLNSLERDLRQGTINLHGGRLLVQTGDRVQAGGRVVELPVEGSRVQIEYSIPARQGVPVILGLVRPEINGISPQNLVIYSDASAVSRIRLIFEFDAIDGVSVGDSVVIRLVITDRGRGDFQIDSSKIPAMPAPRSGWFRLDESALRSGIPRSDAAIGRYVDTERGFEIRAAERQLAVLRVMEGSIAAFIARYGTVSIETLRATVADLDRQITALDDQLSNTPQLSEIQIGTIRAEIAVLRLQKRQTESRINGLQTAQNVQKAANDGIAQLEARIDGLKAEKSAELVLAPNSAEVILDAGRRGIFWVQKDQGLFRVVQAQSLGKAMTRREALIAAARLSAAVGAALATGGCLSQAVIDQIVTEPEFGIPNSLITPAANVTLMEVILKSDKITEILRHPTGAPAERDLGLYIPERSYRIRNARFQRDSATGAQDLLSGFSITPQFSVSTDFAGGFGVQGGFTIQVPAALGGGTLYIPIGVNSLEEDLKATLSFVSMTQNLIVGAGNYLSDMSRIALRTAEYTHDQQVNESLLRVQTYYREIWYLEKAIESANKQIRLLEQEITYADSLIIPGAGAGNIGAQRYKARIQSLLTQKTAERDGFLNDKNTKIETLRRGLNLHPSIQFSFNYEEMNFNLEQVESAQVEDFTFSGLSDVDEMLRIIALTDRRVGEAYGQYEALGHLLWLDSRRVNIPEAVISAFGGHNVADTFLFNPQDQNGINFLKPTNRYGGILLRGPELLGLWARIRNGNTDAEDRLRQQRLSLDAAKTAVLEEIRDAKSDLDGKKDALKSAYRTLLALRQELVDVRTRRSANELDLSDDFAKQREIIDAERDLLKKRAEYLTVVHSFQARYLSRDKDDLRRNVVNSAAAEVQTAKLGSRLLQHTRDLVDSAITWQSRTVAFRDFVSGSSLGSSAKSAELKLENKNFASSILASKIGFLSALFGLVIGAGSRKKAWTQFQSQFDQKIGQLTSASSLGAKRNSIVSIFAEEGELSNNPEFINQFLKRSVDLEVFVKADSQEEAILKMEKYFPEGTLPKNLKVHFYNKRLPIYSVMDKRIAAVAAAGFRPVVVTNESGFFRKLEQAKSVIKVSHEKNYPGELVMEIGRRIGLANGLYDQITGDEKSLIAYDSSRGVFYLRPIEKLINDLFQQVIRDYQIKIAA